MKSLGESGAPSGRHTRRNFSIFLLVVLVISYAVLRPLTTGILWGCVIAFLWHPVNARLVSVRPFKNRPTLSALVSLTVLIVLFSIATTYLLGSLTQDIMHAYRTVSSLIADARRNGFAIEQILPEPLRDFVNENLLDRDKLASTLTTIAQGAAGFLQSLSADVLQMTSSFVLQAFIAMITCFFMLRDGKKVVIYARDLLPFAEADRERFVSRTGRVMAAVAYGTILTVGVQASAFGFGWYVAGLPRALFASFAMFIFGMFPMGHALVWLPGTIYLFASGEIFSGVVMLAWCGAISMIDMLLKPRFMRGEKVPTLATILGLTGGVIAWGFLGVFLGPLMLAVMLSVVELYRSDSRDE